MSIFVTLLILGTTEIKDEVIREIHLLNLLHALELSSEQKEFIIKKIEEKKTIEEELFKKNSEVSRAFAVLKELKDTLLSQRHIPEDLKKRVHKAERYLKEIRRKYEEKITELAFSIKEILKPHQLYIMETYKPCIIPPKETAIGQADDREGITKGLTRIRKLPNKVFEKRKYEIVSATLENIKLHLPKGYILDEEKEKEWLLSFFNEIRIVPEVEFTLRVDEFAERLKSRYEVFKLPIATWVKIEKFLLDPKIAELLKKTE